MNVIQAGLGIRVIEGGKQKAPSRRGVEKNPRVAAYGVLTRFRAPKRADRDKVGVQAKGFNVQRVEETG